ncbi:hypothetical protein E2C01_075035 [Portunus trituberculatus]|uniref:Uncharacterized protein n=1 Tax=Portunus trituberculatus TaxID=210409 RepID=A0A5B7IDZ3_PORTR|nr:hypothetical protein [Portunus trituberculatus]
MKELALVVFRSGGAFGGIEKVGKGRCGDFREVLVGWTYACRMDRLMKRRRRWWWKIGLNICIEKIEGGWNRSFQEVWGLK